MNREERRRNGITKETAKKLEQLNSPCTVMEAVQLAQGVAEDAVSNYHQNINPIIVSLSIQIEVLKELLFKEAALDPSMYEDLFNKRVEEYNKKRDEALTKMKEDFEKGKDPMEAIDNLEDDEEPQHSDVKTDVKPMPVEVEVIHRGDN